MAKVIVEAPAEGREVKSGVIAVNPNNPEFGSIMLSQTGFALNLQGFLNRERRVVFVPGRVEDLEAFVAEKHLTPGCDYSLKLGVPMKIAAKEQTTPFYDNQPIKINPRSGEQIFTADGEPIYRKVFLVEESAENAADVLIKGLATANVAAAAPAAATVLTKAE